MRNIMFPTIDLAATGANITRLRKDRGLSVRDLQSYFGFEEPVAIYKWQKGATLPTVDNLYALSALLDVPMNEILVSTKPKLNIITREEQAAACSSVVFRTKYTGYGRNSSLLRPFPFRGPAACCPKTLPC